MTQGNPVLDQSASRFNRAEADTRHGKNCREHGPDRPGLPLGSTAVESINRL
jgi:hypothetical protein